MLSENERTWYGVFVSYGLGRPQHVHLFLCLIPPFQVSIIEDHLKNLVVISTSESKAQPSLNTKFSFKLRPDCSVYSNKINPQKPNLDFDCVESIVESIEEGGPFADNPVSTGNNKVDGPNPFLLSEGHSSSSRPAYCYATAITSAQSVRKTDTVGVGSSMPEF